MSKEYKTTKEECEKKIFGVCEGCGGKLEPIETVDNGGSPTFWVGCTHCMCFRGGIEERYFKVARECVEKDIIRPYGFMHECEYKDNPDRLDYFYDSQTAGLSFIIKRIDKMLNCDQLVTALKPKTVEKR
jgi:hypothetical protein